MRTATGRSVMVAAGRAMGFGLVLLFALLAGGRTAQASGPRWVGGTPFFWPVGYPLAWYTTHVTYYTDPGDLSASVPHAAADALVANAAAVWNVPTASLVLTQGGALNEHVTGAMVTLPGGGLQMPADVQATAGQQKPIAVIYDADGSVIDALLGAGASDPAGCLQTGVVESVDAFGSNSTIQHAVLILNGRCTGPAPEQQMQMQYQLMRAFGRVLGLGWSQVNDNVFTKSTLPTIDQAEHWPVMHPIDIVCGPYTYQCMPDAFTLRPDDISSLAQLYVVGQGQGATMPGKEDTLQRASSLDGFLTFPNGQGMENSVVAVRRHRNYAPAPEPWQEVSTVSGHMFRRWNGTPVTAMDGSAMSSIGYTNPDWEGYWLLDRIPIEDSDDWQSLVITTEPVNPLYTGPYALQTQASAASTMAPSGSPIQFESDIANRYYQMRYTLTANDAVSSCSTGADGTEGTPAAMDPSGWWTGQLCGYGHSAWTSLTVKPGYTATMEVTALDETGAATAVKAMPMMGLWQSSDAPGQQPTAGATPVAFNSGVTGMSTLQVTGAGSGAMRMVITDQRGAGRPDFAYQARLLYGNSIVPANVPAAGGTVVISGSGFRTGNQVLVNGVLATVQTVTATAMTVTVPTLRQLGATRALLATVVIRDTTTGGMATMQSALGYASPGQRLQVLSAPTGSVALGSAASTSFKVLFLGADGVTPQTGQTITFAVSRGTATFGACGRASCAMVTDAQGTAAVIVTPGALGPLTLTASSTSLTVSASATVMAPDTLRLVTAPSGTATVGAAAPVSFAVQVLAGDGVTPRAGQSLVMTAVAGAARLEACGLPTCNVTTDANGMAISAVTPLVAGTVRLQASGASGTVGASFVAAREVMSLVSAPQAPMVLGASGAQTFGVKVVAGDGVTAVAGEAVVFTAASRGVTFGACGAAVCTVQTDARGLATTTVAAATGGAVTLQAAAASGSVTASFMAGLRSMQVVSLPSGTVPVGSAAPSLMAVRLVAEDGVSPIAGETVQFSVSGGSALLSACGGSQCSVVTDSLGLAQTGVTPESAGTLTVTAQAAEGTATATLTGQALPNVIRIMSQQGGVVAVGETQAAGVTARVFLPDGVTAVAGQVLTFTVTQGSAVLGCGGPVCTGMSDAQGSVAMAVTPGAAGALQVSVSAVSAQVLPVVWTATAIVRVRSLAATVPVMYVAEGRSATWALQVAVSDNSGAVEGVPVSWNGAAGLSVADAASSVTAGLAGTMARVAGLAAGQSVQGSVCAWASVCGAFGAQGVSAAEWHVAVMTSSTSGVTALVTDSLGHPVVSVPVGVQQVVTAWQQACPAAGRCPNPPVLRSATLMLTSDAQGMVAFQPTGLNAGEALQMSLTTGVSGSAQTALVRLP